MKNKSKKGLQLAISTVVLLVLGIVVLAGLIIILTMGWTNFKNSVGNIFSTGSVASVVESCNLACVNNLKFDFCCKNRTVKITSIKEDVTCLDKRLGVKCGNIKCEEDYCDNILKSEENK